MANKDECNEAGEIEKKELNEKDLAEVSGGFAPQPEPPKVATNTITHDMNSLNIAAKLGTK